MVSRSALLAGFLSVGLVVASSQPLTAMEREGLPVRVVYDRGLRFETVEAERFHLTLGGLLQTDHRLYGEDERADDRFDIRRARLSVAGGITPLFRYRFEYEFQGNDVQNLVDAYGELAPVAWAVVRVGQGKLPFGFEWQTRDRDLPFAERTTAADLGPGRDVGLMVHGVLGGEALCYAAGIFNGDGRDGSTRGSEEDAPEVAGRAVVAPFARLGGRFGDLRLGGSATYARIELADVDLQVQTGGMVGTGRRLYVLNRNSKFGVLREAGDRYRAGLEAAWGLGPLALFGEYTRLRYTDLEPAGQPAQDADFLTWYAAGLWAVAAEPVGLRGGTLQPVVPTHPVGDGWGALVLAGRFSSFRGDEDWILEDAHVSVEKATAYTAAVSWILMDELRLTLDYTYTDFSDPLRVRVNPDGSVDYVEKESVLTTRFQFAF